MHSKCNFLFFSEGHICILKWKIYALVLIVDFENCNVSSMKFLLNWKLHKLLCVILKFHVFHIIKYYVVISFCKMSRLCFHFLWCSSLYITKSKFLSCNLQQSVLFVTEEAILVTIFQKPNKSLQFTLCCNLLLCYVEYCKILSERLHKFKWVTANWILS
jgi:hypothetical protein